MGRYMSHSPLDDRAVASFAFARYRRFMRGWAWFSAVVMMAAVGWLYREEGMVSIHFYIATALGVGFTMMLGGALMGLVFLSSGTGHDEAVRDWEEDQSAG